MERKDRRSLLQDEKRRLSDAIRELKELRGALPPEKRPKLDEIIGSLERALEENEAATNGLL